MAVGMSMAYLRDKGKHHAKHDDTDVCLGHAIGS